MATLDKVINQGLIKLDLKGETRGEVIEELTNLLDQQHKLLSKDEFIAKVYEREAVITTYVGSEVAIPHGLSSAVKDPAVCFGRSKGLLWDGLEENVRFVFLLAIPEKRTQTDLLAILSEVAKVSLDPKARALWMKAKTADDILDSLRLSVTETQPKASATDR